jgi:hypothetical protein
LVNHERQHAASWSIRRNSVTKHSAKIQGWARILCVIARGLTPRHAERSWTMNRKHRIAYAAALALGMAGASTAAQADWRYGHRYHGGHRGGDVALGIVGGLAAGALIGGALAQPRHYYAPPPPPPYRVAPTYYAPAYAEPVVTCRVVHQRIPIDPWTYQVRRVRVCD